MGDKTNIPYCNATLNVAWGCTPISPGCANCFAARVASRFRPHLATNGQWNGNLEVNLAKLKQLLSWKRPRVVFLQDMGDLFHDSFDDATLERIFNVVHAAKRHEVLVLTKRAARMRHFFSTRGIPKNAWLGVTVEDQARADERIPELLKLVHHKTWLSVEPQLGPVDLWSARYQIGDATTVNAFSWGNGVRWVVCGGESGDKARLFDLDWARSLRHECVGAGVPFFLKQLGRNPYDSLDNGRKPTGITSQEGRKIEEWPAGLQVQQLPVDLEVALSGGGE